MKLNLEMAMKVWCVALGLMTMVGTASAQWYAGGTVGAGNVDTDCCGSGGGTGFKVYGGYEIPNRHVANLSVEAGYIDFGEASRSGLVSKASLSATAWTGAAVLRMKFNPAFTGVGRLGMANVEATASSSVLIVGASRSDSSFQPYFGLGLEYRLSPKWKVTGSMDFTTYDLGSESGSVRLIGAGAQYEF
jgi:OmpA-OmpF porin, OOP family